MTDGRRRIVAGILAGLAMATLVGWTPNRQQPAPPRAAPHADSGRLDCTSCHAAVHATMVGTAQQKAARCVTCHADAHQAVQTLYEGTDATVQADRMFLARVECRACHTDAALAAPSAAPRLAAIGRACETCHGTRFDKMLPRWAEGLGWRLRAVAAYVAAANANGTLSGRAGAQAQLRAAVADLALVRNGGGLHNVSGADALLRSATRKIGAAYRAAGMTPPPPPALGPDPATTSCAYCHYGIEAVRDTVFGQTFDHRDHVVSAGIACARCHSSADYFTAPTRAVDARHGKTTVTAATCNACHHVTSTLACATCHARDALTGRAIPVTLPLHLQPAGAPTTRVVAFRHDVHAAVQCTSCHTSPTAMTTVAACTSCHESHHRDARDCTACHGPTLLAEHKAADHLTCAECHATQTLALLTGDRTFCVSCHVDRRDHQPSRECAPCHLQMSPAEVQAKILGRRP